MNHLPSPIETQWLFKTQAMTGMAIAVCKLALEGREFSANDLFYDCRDCSGVPGSVFKTLAAHGAIKPIVFWNGEGFTQKTVKNAGGNRIGVWKVDCYATARYVASIPKPEPQLSLI